MKLSCNSLGTIVVNVRSRESVTLVLDKLAWMEIWYGHASDHRPRLSKLGTWAAGCPRQTLLPTPYKQPLSAWAVAAVSVWSEGKSVTRPYIWLGCSRAELPPQPRSENSRWACANAGYCRGTHLELYPGLDGGSIIGPHEHSLLLRSFH
jgi:hypothetical protein